MPGSEPCPDISGTCSQLSCLKSSGEAQRLTIPYHDRGLGKGSCKEMASEQSWLGGKVLTRRRSREGYSGAREQRELRTVCVVSLRPSSLGRFEP